MNADESLAEPSSHTPFVMPRFSRLMWVSARAREAWEWKTKAFAESWRQLEWLTVLHGVRPCASFWLSQRELASLTPILHDRGFSTLSLLWRAEKKLHTPDTLLYRVALGTTKNLRRFHKAWQRGDDDAIGGLLGYPACCRAFFRSVFVERGLSDAVWPMATNSQSSSRNETLIELDDGCPELNPFWREAGVRLTPHHPCRLDCVASIDLAKAFCEVGRKSGDGKSIDAALEILRWPVEWSSLHGIAEIRTPILKISRNTDATNRKLIIRKAGGSFPDEGARGLNFALRSPSRPPSSRHELPILSLAGEGG